KRRLPRSTLFPYTTLFRSEGHTIGNHSYSHSKNFGFFSSEKVIAELNKTNSVLKEIIGKELKLFRPPFGVTNPNIKKGLKNTGRSEEHTSELQSRENLVCR